MGRSSYEQSLKNRAHILDKACALFRRDGVDNVSVAGVMHEAGLTVGGFYRHFASKDALVSEAFSRVFTQSAASWRHAARPAQRVAGGDTQENGENTLDAQVTQETRVAGKQTSSQETDRNRGDNPEKNSSENPSENLDKNVGENSNTNPDENRSQNSGKNLDRNSDKNSGENLGEVSNQISGATSAPALVTGYITREAPVSGNGGVTAIIRRYFQKRPPDQTCPMLAFAPHVTQSAADISCREAYGQGTEALFAEFLAAMPAPATLENKDPTSERAARLLFAAMVGAKFLERTTGNAGWTAAVQAAAGDMDQAGTKGAAA